MDFRDYLRRQIQDRHMTIREFAAFIDVAPSTISRAIDERDPKPHGLDFLMKLSQATGERLGVLIDIAYPDFAIGEAISPTTRAYRKTKLAALARAGIAYAALRTVNDQSVCDFCRQNRSKVYPLADFPDLPQPNCTDESGCRSYPHPASQGE